MASGYSDLSEIRKDSQNYAAYTKPPKINLLDEKPRRESVIEQQLATSVVRYDLGGQRQLDGTTIGQPLETYDYQQQVHSSRFQQQPSSMRHSQSGYVPSESGSSYRIAYHPEPNQYVFSGGYPSSQISTSTRTITTSINEGVTSELAALERDLSEKEAKLKREIAYMNQHNLSPWSRPRQFREPRKEPSPNSIRKDSRWVRECPSGPPSRSNSRASTAEADLMERASKLLEDVEEFQRKPMNKQEILIESGPGGAKVSPLGSERVSSIHTAVIKTPERDVDNRSPLPFAFDNFSTLGVRGNIASVGAAEPEKPYPPIFPNVKRSQSPIKHK